jgi:hypothetical protein
MTRHVTSVLTTLVATFVLAATGTAQTPSEIHLRRLLSVPFGALPPVGMLMPASRNHSYWVGRLQAGTQWDVPGNLAAYAAGVDFQWRGGSTFGLTAGYQDGNCEGAIAGCAGHALFGARARVNLLTGGPTVAALIGDNGATTTLGGELGYGFAPNSVVGRKACAVDVGMPISVALFQRIRVLSFFTPGIAWDVRCVSDGSPGLGASTFAAAGVGIQQLWHPGLDVSVGVQKIFRSEPGIQIGLTVTFVNLP